MAAYAL